LDQAYARNRRRVEPLNAMHDVSFNWYLGLDAAGSRIGDALWHGHDLDEQSRSSVVGLYQLNFNDPDVVDLGMRGQPVYLILAMAPDKVLHVKPQNLLTGCRSARWRRPIDLGSGCPHVCRRRR